MPIARFYDKRLLRQAWPPGFADKAKKPPFIILDGRAFTFKELAPIRGESAYIIGADDKHLPAIAANIDAEYIYFYEIKAVDLSPLANIGSLKHLKLEWNTKIETIEGLRHLTNLETLAIEDHPKLRDMEPVSKLKKLTSFAYRGGMWNPIRARSLDPIACLSDLEELGLENIVVEEGGLRPLAKCKNLRILLVSNQFETSDYAYLSVTLPNLVCDRFAPWWETRDGYVLVTGKRKPHLHRVHDAEKIAQYEAKFRKLQEEFRAQLP